MKVLLVEDEPEVAKYIIKGLEQAHCVVDTVDDGKLGLYSAAINQYDLIVCDYMLPFRDGITLTKALRERSIHTPLMMLTVVDDLDTKVRALDAGADDFMCKPFTFQELLARVRALMRRQQSYLNNRLEVADLTMDVALHEVTRSGQSIHLTRKEFILLELLMRNVDRVVSRTEITEHLWESNVSPLHNAIEVHVRYLRKKIDLPWGASGKLLYTVHGIGYKMVAQPGVYRP